VRRSYAKVESSRKERSTLLSVTIITMEEDFASLNTTLRSGWAGSSFSRFNSGIHDGSILINYVGVKNATSFKGLERDGCMVDSYEEGVCCKTERAFVLAHRSNPLADWYLRCSEDAFIFPRNILRALNLYNSSEMALVGRVGYVGITEHPAHKYSKSTIHVSGGTCIVMSNPLVAAFSRISGKFRSICLHDDSDMGAFLWNNFRVLPSELRFMSQLPKLDDLAAIEFLQPAKATRSCGREVLSRQFTARHRAWGELFPYVAVNLEEVSALHCNPDLFPLVRMRILNLIALAEEEGLAADNVYLYVDLPHQQFAEIHPYRARFRACFDRRSTNNGVDGGSN